MKRTLSFLLVLVTSISVFAADLIVTKDSKSINAVITEVSKSEVKYKDVSKPDGPVFVLGTDEILTIIYDNGTVQNFSVQSTAASSSASENSNKQESSQTGIIPTSGRITQKGNTYFINDIQIAENYTEVEKWISTNQTNIYNDFKDSKKSMANMITAGYSLWMFGGVFVGGLAGGLLLGGAESITGKQLGAACVGIGCACFAVGLPLNIVGSVRKKNANLISYYNDHIPSYVQTPLRLELQGSQNGIGLALKF